MERTPVSLSRVGVTNVEKVVRIGPRGAEQLYYAKLACVVDLGPEQRGAHMSRFDGVVNDVIGEVVLGESGSSPSSWRSTWPSRCASARMRSVRR